MADSMNTDTTLGYLVRQFEDAVDTSYTERQNAETHRDYYDGIQWSPGEKATLQQRKQPCITDNRIKDKVEYLLGMERRTRTDPKAYPRTPQDEPAAEAATDALRYVADCNAFPQVKSKVAENIFIEGMGGCEVIVEPDPKGGNPKIKQRYIRWDRIYRDPHSLLADFADAEYMGIVVWMDLDKAKGKYPALSDQFDELMTTGIVGSPATTYDDKPTMWIDKTRRRVQILEHYFRKGGVWHRCVFSKAGVIEEPKPSAYLDENGEPECPLILQSCYVDRDGRRYGVVARYKDLQDEINKRRSKALHLLSVNQVVGESGAVDDIEALRKEAARPDGVIMRAPGMELEVVRNTELANGQFQLLQDALNAFAMTGPNAALQGQSGSVSGRAKEIDAQGGEIQLGILFDSVRHWQTRVMRATWNRVKQFWTAEQWIRVTDNEGAPKFVGLNVPDPMTGMYQNQVAQVDVDIVIDESPDVINLQSEQWMQLTELASKGVPIPPDVLIRASSLRNKKELEDRLTNGGQMPPEVAQQLQAQQQGLQEAAAKVQEEAQKVAAEAQDVENQKAELNSIVAEIKMQRAELKALQADIRAQAAEKAVALSERESQVVTKEGESNAVIDRQALSAELQQAVAQLQQQTAQFMQQAVQTIAEIQQRSTPQVIVPDRPRAKGIRRKGDILELVYDDQPQVQ